MYICLARRKDKGLSTRNASCDYSSVLQSMTQEYDAAVVGVTVVTKKIYMHILL